MRVINSWGMHQRRVKSDGKEPCVNIHEKRRNIYEGHDRSNSASLLFKIIKKGERGSLNPTIQAALLQVQREVTVIVVHKKH